MLKCISSAVTIIRNHHYHNVKQSVLLRHLSSQSSGQKQPTPMEIMLKDINGKLLGVKNKIEAENLARKSHMKLVLEPRERIGNKEVYRMMSIAKKLTEDEDVNVEEEEANAIGDKKENKESTSSPAKKINFKRIGFSVKASEHDIMTKMKQIKKWIERCQHVRVVISGNGNEKKLIEALVDRFETEMKADAKLTQKKFTGSECRFTMQPLHSSPKEKDDHHSDNEDSKQSDLSDLDNLDPNQLLSDDFDVFKKK